jgi:hypothetical protein
MRTNQSTTLRPAQQKQPILDFPLGRIAREKFSFLGSIYQNACPTCGAKPMAYCLTRERGRQRTPHSARGAAGSSSKARVGQIRESSRAYVGVQTHQ